MNIIYQRSMGGSCPENNKNWADTCYQKFNDKYKPKRDLVWSMPMIGNNGINFHWFWRELIMGCLQ